MSYIFCVFTCKNSNYKVQISFDYGLGSPCTETVAIENPSDQVRKTASVLHQLCPVSFGSPTTIAGIPAQRLRAEACLYPVIKVGSFFHKRNVTQDTWNLTAASAHCFRGSCSSSAKTRYLQQCGNPDLKTPPLDVPFAPAS